MNDYIFEEIRILQKRINRTRTLIYLLGVGLATTVYAINKCNERLDKLERREEL